MNSYELGNLGTFYKGAGISRDDANSGELPAIRYGELYTDYNTFILENTRSKISEGVAEGAFRLECGDILLAGSGETPEDIGKSAVFLLKKGYAGGDIIVFRSDKTIVDPKFLALYFETESWKKQRRRAAQGQSVVHIHATDLKKMIVRLPDLEDQQKIVRILETTASLCKLYIKQGEIETQKLKALKYELFYNTDKAGDVVKLKDLFVFKTGYTPSKSNAKYWDDGTIPWFRMEDIRKNGRILNDSIQHVTRAAIKGKIFPANSIIMSTTATIGEYALLTSDSLANQQFTFLTRKVNCCECINITYFYHYCSILSEWCKRNVNSGGLLAVDMKAFENYKMKLPAIDEQAKIAKILSMQEQKIDLLNKMTKCARKQHKYLLNHLINGDLDLSKIQLEEKDKSC